MMSHARSVASWRIARTSPGGEVARVLEELRRHGVAKSSVQALGMGSCWEPLDSRGRGLADDASRSSGSGFGHGKDFVFPLLGDKVTVDSADAFTQAALHPNVLQLANEYLGCFARLNYFNVWLNLPTAQTETSSQLWHRDPGDSRIFKMFVLLSEMTDETGAFSYLKGSHFLGKWATLSPPSTHDGASNRSTDSQLERVVPSTQWSTMRAQPAEIVFADTAGLHKGGFVKRGHLLLFVAEYIRRVMEQKPDLLIGDLGTLARDPAARWAVR